MDKRGALIVSQFCDYGCTFCLGIPNGISKQDVENLDKTLFNNIENHIKNGIQSIELSGADPGEYYRIEDLIHYLKNVKKFKQIILSTNGFRSATMLDKLYNAGLDEMRIPIYGSTDEIHNKVISKKGALERSIHIMKNFKGVVTVNAPITPYNIDDLENMHKLFNEYKVNHVCYSKLFVADGNWSYFLPIKDNYKKIRYFYNLLKNTTNYQYSFDYVPCVFGEMSGNIIMISKPPKLGMQQPKADLKTEIEDMPSYRIREYGEICHRCSNKNNCTGFNKNELLKYGYGDIQPL